MLDLDPPELVFDWSDPGIRAIADNIFHAQQAGWPEILHYDGINDEVDRKQKMSSKRYSAMRVASDDLLEKDGSVRKGYEALTSEVEEGGALQVPTIRNSDPKLSLPSRDEYPFACTREHAGKVWVGHVPPEQNSRQGNMIRTFLKAYKAADGFAFRVRIINHPLARVEARIPTRPKR